VALQPDLADCVPQANLNRSGYTTPRRALTDAVKSTTKLLRSKRQKG